MFRKLHLGQAIASLALAGMVGTAAPVHAQNSEAGAAFLRVNLGR